MFTSAIYVANLKLLNKCMVDVDSKQIVADVAFVSTLLRFIIVYGSVAVSQLNKTSLQLKMADN